ncbi:ADP oxidoreductase, coenzyme F420-dependent [Methylorubrum populi]|uniref:ADP oxidoreductase, coenzyme F420-dependent n=1 Tax=Methylorubrum populi TaxID=223967 RepID=A0A169QEC7_9HYPH|nr:NADPH-dependent F420 reductase [Methylorubrum populi]BAU88769.1 ADP oxidoreductase, coenzyme F420-dependent [Methylorubrum populi]
MKIGIVGSGRIGGLIGKLWSRAGHEVLFSSRNPQTLGGLVEQAGGSARAGTPEQAIAFGDAVLMSVPFLALPEYGRTMAETLGGKVVLDTSNPYPNRDGAMAEEVRRSGRGTGPYLREWFPGVHIVRAFNTVWDRTLESEAHRAGPRVGIPLASDDAEVMRIAAALVTDAGFDPVTVGPLDRSREFDMGTPVYDTGMSGPEVREALGLPQA